MDLNKIFNSFEDDREVEVENNDSFFNFKETPLFKIGMFKKIILNNSNFNKKISNFLKNSNKELDENEISNAGEWFTYNKAWDYIKDIDINNKLHIQAIKSYSDEYLDTSLELGILYFEEKEIYENCAHLKKILDFTKNIEK